MDLGGSVTLDMTATPDEVWAVVSDVTRIGELSPETFEAEWLEGATGPATGAYFRGHVNRNNSGILYWSRCRVSECEPGRTFAFEVYIGSAVINTWRYEIAPSETGSTVTESFRLVDTWSNRVYWGLLGRWRGRTNSLGMAQTLARVKAIVEA